jgi:hypothetical protein
MNFSPVGRPGYYGFEQTQYQGGTYTWIPTRQRWELSGGQPYNDMMNTSPNQAFQNALAKGKTTKQALDARKTQTNRLTDPSKNYQYGASVKTGTGQIIADYQSSQKAIEQMKQQAGDKLPPAVKQAVDAYTKQAPKPPPIINQAPPKPKPAKKPPKAPSPPPPRPLPPKPPRVDFNTQVVRRPYKQLKNYNNQYPAVESSVKSDIDFQPGDINNYYRFMGTIIGHMDGNKETIPLDPKILSATVNNRLTTDFIVNIRGTYYVGPALRANIHTAKSKGNNYFLQSIPVIVVNPDAIRPYKREPYFFGAEEEYAFNAPTDRIDSIDEILDHISWTCRKVSGIDEPREFDSRYANRDAINVDVDAIIASANKPLKIRWRRNS